MPRRGFAAEAERLSLAVRDELCLGVHDRLDPQRLASEYGTPLAPITELLAEGAKPESIRQLTLVDARCFSAGTVLVESHRLIVYNPVHSDRRRANSLTHELAHLLLEHPPGPATGPGGCRVWDQEMEEEADVLAGALLVPREGALACARVGLPHEIGAHRFGVSSQLMRWRTDQTGAARQARTGAQQRGRSIPHFSPADTREIVAACDLSWLQNITAQQWIALLSAWGRIASTASVESLISSLQQPSTIRTCIAKTVTA